ncbi:uncharacterized protein K02A2.6-like [Mercenaria mercenaria]|uniref:uncharacterized protein K02A2.6-like n=1 Tax=Mercenaria mercenaria TaxID=6596 RepID=UPI00234EB470|nr:uncharacterized protein K02A2.6-like [Mercenaria mercenaria]
MAQGLPVFSNFVVNEPAVDTRWKKWCQRLENLLIGLDITNEKRKRALLLHYAGEEVNDIFDTLSETGDDYKTALLKLTEYFAPKKCTEYEVYKFRQAKQESSETIDTYHTRLRQLCENCEFAEKDKEIKSQIIQGCQSTRLRRKALKQDITLDELIQEARALELSDKHASEIEHGTSESANKVTKRKFTPKKITANKPNVKQKQRKCRNCGFEYPHKTKCPAQGKECLYCHKKNHFESVCRSKTMKSRKTHNLNDYSSSDDSDQSDNYAFGLTVNAMSRRPYVSALVNGHNVKFLIDTGSSVNVLDQETYNKMNPKPKLQKPNLKVFAYGTDSHVKLLGKFVTTVETKQKYTTAEILVTEGKSGNLLSYLTSVELQVIPEIQTLQHSKVDEICKNYNSVFTGIGKYKDKQIDLIIDSDVQPVSQPHRRIPFHQRKQVEKELKRLEDLDIIEKVEGATDWVSPIVVTSKPKSKTNEIRLCVDMRLPNTAIKRTKHIIPTLDDMIVDLNGAKVFSKLDLNQGYHQLELSESSRNVTTFTTHVGIRRYKRLSFGINSAAEIFQNTLRTALEGLDGVRNISDDIIVYAENQAQHDKRLEAVLKRLQDKGFTLNKKKCEFNKRKIEFFGYVFSEDGISADPKKCEAIKNAQAPTNVSEVRSFLAMTNYVSRFIPNYSTITEPLRQLIKKGVDWKWDKEQQDAFETLKNNLSSNTVMTYFNPKAETELIVDASPVGIAAIMLQNGKVVCYASKSLTDVEKRYSQTERENLAIVWAIEHWHIYLYGHSFTLISDAKALEHIYANPKSKPPARLERWRMRLQAYDFRVKYRSGESNMSDYLSRHPDAASSKQSKQSKHAEEHISFIAHHCVPKAVTMKEVISATRNDSDLQTVISNVKSSKWIKSQNSVIDTFARCKNALTVVYLEGGEVLLHESKLVIPKSLQDKVINIAHEGHQGIVKTKQLLREKVYFPGIDKLVEKKCKSCIPCLAATKTNSSEPLNMSEMPEYTFQHVSLDFAGPFPDGKYLLVLIDEYSRFPIVEIINSTSSKTVIPVLDKIFSEFGICEVLKSDNGPPMNGHEFAQFANYMGFKHRKITPLWPQANGECERFMRSIGKAIRASHAQGTSWKQDMYSYLRNYRATPHASTHISPAELFYGRSINIKIPSVQIPSKQGEKHKKARQSDKKAKQKMKSYADTRRHAKPSNLKIGDTVLVKQKEDNKLTPPFDPRPYEIISKKGTMITAKREDKQITRNSSEFKNVENPPPLPSSSSSIDNDNIINIPTRNNSDSSLTRDSTNSQPVRRSQRERKPPEYLKDYVTH